MGAKVVRSPRNAKGKSRSFYPVTFSPQLVFPASPVHGPYMSQYIESPKRPQLSEVSGNDFIRIGHDQYYLGIGLKNTITTYYIIILRQIVLHGFIL